MKIVRESNFYFCVVTSAGRLIERCESEEQANEVLSAFWKYESEKPLWSK